MGERPPRPSAAQLLALANEAIDDTSLDLAGASVLTEAATGAYAVTPVIAALGGASHVDAVTRPSRHGSLVDATEQTFELAELAGVADSITIHDAVTSEMVARADVVTNSGHVRPIDARIAGWMRSGAVVPLMFEAWEIDLGRDDVDLAALRAAGVRYAGTNERHPAVDVFSHLGPMAVKLLADASISVLGSRVLLICDNPFMPYLRDGLGRAGASVIATREFSAGDVTDDLDTIVVALKPRSVPVLTSEDVFAVAERASRAVIAQFWGDLPRTVCERLGVRCVPPQEPGLGHMGVLPDAVGPEPIVRLQTGGFKVASILLRPEANWTVEDRSYVDEC